jgi:hypothetical protein
VPAVHLQRIGRGQRGRQLPVPVGEPGEQVGAVQIRRAVRP